ncbi:transposable element Tcb1 transposase [Trichonephila clavipes]|nr:transposable element Tcb1 transposase [Trichonephila clavipes]
MHMDQPVHVLEVIYLWRNIFSHGNVNPHTYRDYILDDYLLPCVEAIRDAFVLQNENTRQHRAYIVDSVQGTIQRMHWPAQSLDFNPIEHVWDPLGCQLAALNPSLRTLSTLPTALED